MTEAHYAPDEEMTITTEYLEPDPSTFDVTEEGDSDVVDDIAAEEPVEGEEAEEKTP
jgi:hypothetical protein